MFVIEKRTHDKIEGYVLDISETREKKLKEDDKRNPKEEPIKHFEITFQTQNENLRAVSFSPEKRKRLAQFKTDDVSCVISNLIQSNEKEVKLTNNSTVKPKTVAFPKNEDYEYCDIDTLINEIELLRCVNIILKVVHIADVRSSRNLMLQEYLVTDDRENTIPLTMFEDLTQVLKKNTTYKILNVQVVTYKNKKNCVVQD